MTKEICLERFFSKNANQKKKKKLNDYSTEYMFFFYSLKYNTLKTHIHVYSTPYFQV